MVMIPNIRGVVLSSSAAKVSEFPEYQIPEYQIPDYSNYTPARDDLMAVILRDVTRCYYVSFQCFQY